MEIRDSGFLRFFMVSTLRPYGVLHSVVEEEAAEAPPVVVEVAAPSPIDTSAAADVDDAVTAVDFSNHEQLLGAWYSTMNPQAAWEKVVCGLSRGFLLLFP